jgi:hypothetical protein
MLLSALLDACSTSSEYRSNMVKELFAWCVGVGGGGWMNILNLSGSGYGRVVSSRERGNGHWYVMSRSFLVRRVTLPRTSLHVRRNRRPM